jgi:hypothetical protein
MKRTIYADSQISKVDPNAPHNQNKESTSSLQTLETVKSLPAGYDPIFSLNTNQSVANKSHIKIKPMRLSKGFEHSEYRRGSEAFDNTETSSVSALSKGNSMGTLESIT